ncbi:Bromodomain-containing protein [Lepidopterella palustris CBS 459.81]|uniref:Bromodomain-containing protein n=1 Tax=Lepidopterella palustris CBS 459.81 TaxID=1314670 RepID=A0A8E2E516_9PEZI|nr:Bromodomain-containing protein [Lepidopterella palustris CBS 459.81]
MERETKRKAPSAASPDNEGRAVKRQKLPGDAEPTVETVESTTAVGLKFVESLKAAKDKTGRPIATHFLTLPDRNQIPEYYEEILLPIAIDTIEAKLIHGGYPTLSAVESDVKRLVNNAKTFNDKKSLIYEDAERVRKTASNFMVKHNPAYRDPGYVAVATPIPGDATNGTLGAAHKVHKPVIFAQAAPPPTPEAGERPRRAAAVSQTPVPPPPKRSRSAGRQSAAPEADDDNPDFTGKTFQQAQEQIVREMINYTENDLQIFQPFINLPNRALKDYYQVIKNPMSLTRISNKVKGVQGRNPPTGITDLKSWNAFEDEVSMIWKNARHYNEDGSDISNLATELEEFFMQRLAEAKAKVEEPPQPKLKINMSAPKSQSIKLRLGGPKGSPGPTSAPDTPAGRSSATPGVIVDSDALERQQRHVQAGMNGGQRPPSSGTPSQGTMPRNPFGGSRPSSTSIPPLNQDKGFNGATSPPVLNGVKSESQAVQSPALNTIRLSSAVPESQKDGQRPSVSVQAPQPAASAMPPPLGTTPRPLSGSPHPAVGQQPHYNSQNYYAPPPPQAFENHRRAAGKTAADALIPSITLSAHPLLNLPHPWCHSIPASKERTQQSVTMTLPSSHHYLQIIPYMPIALTGRLYRLFVTVNGSRVLEVTRPVNGVGVGVGAVGADVGGGGGGKEKGKPVFEAKLVQGVNRIEVEAVAEKEVRKGGKKEGGQVQGVGEVEGEKFTVFVHLMRPF